MSRMDSKERMEPFNIDTLALFINENSDDINSYLTELDKKDRYIEVQLWNDEYLNNIL